MKGIIHLLLVSIALIPTSFETFGQTFEGSITYKVVAHNPSPEMIPDSTWENSLKEQFGERGYMLQKYFYKKGNYISEIDAGKESGFQAYNSEDGLLYSWVANSDSAITIDSKKYMDGFVEIITSDKVDTVLGISCNSIIVKSKMGQMTLWYNNDYFKMDATLYKGHLYGHWTQILDEIGCLPLKMEQKSYYMGHVTQEAIEFNEEPVNDSKFILPEFKEIMANPMN